MGVQLKTENLVNSDIKPENMMFDFTHDRLDLYMIDIDVLRQPKNGFNTKCVSTPSFLPTITDNSPIVNFKNLNHRVKQNYYSVKRLIWDCNQNLDLYQLT